MADVGREQGKKEVFVWQRQAAPGAATRTLLLQGLGTMKILYVVTGRDYGGAVRHVIQLIRYMSEMGHTVGLISGADATLMQVAARYCTKHYVNRDFVHPLDPRRDIRAVIPVWKGIREFEPDIVHAHSTKAGYAARFCAALQGIRPVVFTAHGWAFMEGRAYWQRWLLASAEKVFARVTDKIICVSEHARQLAVEWGVGSPDQLVVIHNGVDPTPFLNAHPLEMPVKSETETSPIITFVGRLAPPKDLSTLFRALAFLECGHLLVVGEGQLRPSLEKEASQLGLAKRVTFAGFQSDIPGILKSSDIFVLPSRWEGLPYVVIEAMMAGLPVVATAVGGVPELVEHGRTGYLVPPGDTEALARALHDLLQDEALRRQMGEAGRERALRQFTEDRMLSRTEALYREVLG